MTIAEVKAEIREEIARCKRAPYLNNLNGCDIDEWLLGSISVCEWVLKLLEEVEQ